MWAFQLILTTLSFGDETHSVVFANILAAFLCFLFRTSWRAHRHPSVPRLVFLSLSFLWDDSIFFFFQNGWRLWLRRLIGSPRGFQRYHCLTFTVSLPFSNISTQVAADWTSSIDNWRFWTYSLSVRDWQCKQCRTRKSATPWSSR